MDDRRRIVEFTQDDRKMLIEHDLKLGILCGRVDDLGDTMEDGFQRILDKMDIQKDKCSEHREKISSRYFTKKVLIPVLGLMIISLISVGVYSVKATSKVTSEVHLNTYKIDKLNDYHDKYIIEEMNPE
jgi:flagellar biosynthesis regulator FlaF